MTTQPPTPSPTRPPKPVSRTPVAFVTLAVACVAAAGVGGYLAQSRQAPLPLPAVEASPAARPASNVVAADAASTPANGHGTAKPVGQPTPEPSAPSTVAESGVATPSLPVEAPAPPSKAPTIDSPSRERVAAASPKPSAPRANPVAVPAATPSVAAARTPEPAPAQPMPGPDPVPAVASAEPQRPPAPAEPAAAKPAVPDVETFVIPADAVMGLEIERSISSETARVEDHVEARVTRDVRGDGNVVLISAGTRVRGEVTLVESGGKFKERARLAIKFHTLLLTDGQSVPIATDPLVREGDGVGQRTSTRIGASAAGGAIIGAIFGGQKGAAIGAAAGAGAGTAATAASRPSEARFRAGSVVTVRLTAPVSITIEH